LKRLVILIAVLLLILLVVGVLGWLCLRFLGPSVIEDNEGVWHIIDILVTYPGYL
jgi:hypothetical protein